MQWVRRWGVGWLAAGLSACASSETPAQKPDGGGAVACAETQLACDDGQAQTWASCSAGTCVTGGAYSVLQPFESKSWANAVSASADGKLLAVAAEGELAGGAGQFAILDRQTGAVVLRKDQVVIGVSFSPDSSLIALGSSPVVILSTRDFSEVKSLAGTRGPVMFSPDGETLAVFGDGGAKLFATSDWSEEGELAHPLESEHERASALRFSPDGELIATSSGQVGFGSPHGMTRLWKRSDRSLLKELDCHTMDAAFSPDGQRLATACWQKALIWDTATGESLGSIPANQTYAVGVAFTPDGKQLALGTFGGGAQLFDLATRERRHLLADDAGRPPLPSIKALQFDPSSGVLIGAAWNDTRAFVWTLPATP